MQTLYIQSYDATPLYCYLWDDVAQPKGVVQISHGMGEHAGRYDEFARRLNKAGYLVFADDHRAHGKTETDAQRGRHAGDIYAKTLQDLVFLHGWLKEKYGLPQVLLGHSYGSFLAQGFLQSGTDVLAVACCGTANMHGAQATLALIWPLQLLCKNWRPRFVNKAADVLFDLQYKGERGPSQWVTGDPVRREAFVEDPLTNVDMSINFDWSMIKAFGRIYKKENLAKLQKETPIAIFSGTRDPIGGNGLLAKRLYTAHQGAGVRRVEYHTYPDARHELHNDCCREAYYRDVIAFFDSVL